MVENSLLNDVNRKLAKSRSYCIDLPDEIYLLADYMSKVVENSSLTVLGMMNSLVQALNYIKFCKCGFEERYLEIPKELVDNKDNIFEKIGVFTHLVDSIADEEYAKSFRNIFAKHIGEPVPKKSIILHLPINKDNYVECGYENEEAFDYEVEVVNW